MRRPGCICLPSGTTRRTSSGRSRLPGCTSWRGTRTKLASELTQIAQNDADDLVARKKLAQMALAGGDYPAACRWAGECLDIDVSDPALHGVFAEALLGCHNHAKAVEEFDAAVELAPDEPGFRLAWRRRTWRPDGAMSAKEVVRPLQ